MSDAVVDVLVVGVAPADVARQAVDGQVHLAEPYRGPHPLLTVDADLGVGVPLAFADKAGALYEHAAGATGGVQNTAVEGLDDRDDELDEGGGGEELAALLALRHGEVAQEVLVDLAEDVTLDVHGDRVEDAH